MEHPMAIALLDQFVTGKLMHPQSIALPDHLRQFGKFIRHLLRHLHLHLQIVVILLETSDALHVLWIIRIVIVDVHRRELIESLYEHAFTIGVDESQGACHLRHALFASPVLDRLQQGCADLQVVDEIEPPEAHLMTVPSLIGTTIDNRCHTANHLPILESQEILSLATLERRILVATQGHHLLGIQERHGTIVTAIKVVIELNELFQFTSRFNFFYLNHHFVLSVKPKHHSFDDAKVQRII